MRISGGIWRITQGRFMRRAVWTPRKPIGWPAFPKIIPLNLSLLTVKNGRLIFMRGIVFLIKMCLYIRPETSFLQCGCPRAGPCAPETVGRSEVVGAGAGDGCNDGGWSDGQSSARWKSCSSRSSVCGKAAYAIRRIWFGGSFIWVLSGQCRSRDRDNFRFGAGSWIFIIWRMTALIELNSGMMKLIPFGASMRTASRSIERHEEFPYIRRRRFLRRLGSGRVWRR